MKEKTKTDGKACEECGGIGNYEVLNAYTLDATWVTCEYCNGTGLHNPNIIRLSMEHLVAEDDDIVFPENIPLC